MENDYVTRAELNAHLNPIRSDIKEIKNDVKTLLRGSSATTAVRNVGKWLLPMLVVAGTSLIMHFWG